MRAVGVLALCSLAATVPAAADVRVTVAQIVGRTSVVFSADAPLTAPSLVIENPTTVIVRAQATTCDGVRLDAAPDARHGVVSVWIDCPGPRMLRARITVRLAARPSIRAAANRLYVDFTPAAPALAVAAQTSRPSTSPRLPTTAAAAQLLRDNAARNAGVAAHAAPASGPAPVAAPPVDADERIDTTHDAVYVRATALANRGDVRALQNLIAATRDNVEPPASDDMLLGRLKQLLETAQKRRLELDRALFANRKQKPRGDR